MGERCSLCCAVAHSGAERGWFWLLWLGQEMLPGCGHSRLAGNDRQGSGQGTATFFSFLQLPKGVCVLVGRIAMICAERK